MKRILVCSPKGGCGKTSMVRCLAVAAASDGLTVATADLDPQRTLSKWWNRRPDTDVAQFAHYPVEWDDVESLTTDGAIDAVDLLIIDTPPSIEERPGKMKALVSAANLVLVPCRPSLDDLESAVPFIAAVRQFGRPVWALVNATAPRINVNDEKALLMEATDVVPVEVRQRVDHMRAARTGLTVMDFPKHEGAKEVDAVWKHLKRQLFPVAPPKRKEGRRVAA